MLEQKRKIIDKIKKLDEHNLYKLLHSDEFTELYDYYTDNGLIPIMSLDDIMSNIDDVYIEGDITYFIDSIYGNQISLYIPENDTNPIKLGTFHGMNLSRYIKVPDKAMLDGILPEDGVRVYINLQDYPEVSIQFVAKKIEKLDHKVAPIKICPKCKYISDNRKDNSIKC